LFHGIAKQKVFSKTKGKMQSNQGNVSKREPRIA
jgi:hypothetical protein